MYNINKPVFKIKEKTIVVDTITYLSEIWDEFIRQTKYQESENKKNISDLQKEIANLKKKITTLESFH